MRYAIIDNTTGSAGLVTNIAVGDNPQHAGWIPNPPPHVQIGWHYNGSGGYTAPLIYTMANTVIKAAGANLKPFAGNYYCQPGDTIEVSGTIMDANGAVTSINIPVALKMPLVRHANGQPTQDEIYLNVTLLNGQMTATGIIEGSGDWKILIDRNNEALKRIGAQWKLSAADVTFLA